MVNEKLKSQALRNYRKCRDMDEAKSNCPQLRHPRIFYVFEKALFPVLINFFISVKNSSNSPCSSLNPFNLS